MRTRRPPSSYTQHRSYSGDSRWMATPAPKKAKAVDEVDVSEMVSTKDCITVHGVVTELSPIKTSTGKNVKYFTGKLSDGNKTLRMVSFDPKLRPQLLNSYTHKKGVAMAECAIKEASSGGTFEILASQRRSSVEDSPKKFSLSADLRSIDPDKSMEVHIEELETLVVNQHVSIHAKVLSVAEPEEVESKKKLAFTAQARVCVG